MVQAPPMHRSWQQAASVVQAPPAGTQVPTGGRHDMLTGSQLPSQQEASLVHMPPTGLHTGVQVPPVHWPEQQSAVTSHGPPRATQVSAAKSQR